MVNQSQFRLGKHSIGVGDRFGYQGVAQLAWDAGVHLKTAGTTWLEECIGLAAADEAGAVLFKEIYAQAYEQRDDLMAPYREVLDIDVSKLPLPREIASLPGQALADSITHRPAEPLYNRHMRQLMHVAYKLAADRASSFVTGALIPVDGGFSAMSI